MPDQKFKSLMEFSERSLKFMIVATKDAGRHSRRTPGEMSWQIS